MIVATVVTCDGFGCQKVGMLRDEAEWEAFDLLWLNLINTQFCPECRETPEAADALREEADYLKAVAAFAANPVICK